MLKQTLILTGALALLLCGLKPAHAQLSLTFAPDTESGVPGSTVTFSGTLTNGGGSTLFINNDSPNLIGSGLTLDDSNFFANVPTTLGPGDTTGLIELFDVSIDPLTAFAPYPGSFSVVGGANAGSQDSLVITNFTVTVAPSAPPLPPPVNTPEPGSLALLLSAGVPGLLCVLRRSPRK